MSEATTAFYTVLTGYLVYIFGQFTINLILDPIKRQKEAIGEIQDAVTYYANVFSPMIKKSIQNEATERFRKLASHLVSNTRVIPFYYALRHIFGLPSLNNINRAYHCLIGLSNSVGNGKDAYKLMADLEKALSLMFINE
jgi:hypothetical protein